MSTSKPLWEKHFIPIGARGNYPSLGDSCFISVHYAKKLLYNMEIYLPLFLNVPNSFLCEHIFIVAVS